MLAFITWTVAGVALLAAGWSVSAWWHGRHIRFLTLQLKAVRQTAAAHNDQARRQIGMLQAELAARPRPPAPEPEPDAQANAALEDGFRRRPAAPDRYVLMEDGFPQTAVIGDGFKATELMR